MQAIRKYLITKIKHHTLYYHSSYSHYRCITFWDKIYLQLMFDIIAESIEEKIDNGEKIPEYLWYNLRTYNKRLKDGS